MQTTNLVLTILFTIEMVIKHAALGILGYWSNGFNVLDGIIVVASLVDLGLQYTGITTVTVTVNVTLTLTLTLTTTIVIAITTATMFNIVVPINLAVSQYCYNYFY